MMHFQTLQALLILILLSIVHAVPITLSRAPHTLMSLDEAKALHGSARKLAGNTIPMGGGIMTIGYYTANITIGTPPQTFTLLVDTGSSNTIVPAQGCDSCGATYFISASSSTYQETDCKSEECQICNPNGGSADCVFGAPYCVANTSQCGFGVSYGGGSSLFQGYWATDNVCFGGLCIPATFGMATAEYPAESFYMAGVYSGILGLASPFNACNPTCVTTILDAYVEAQLVKNLFSMCITGSNGGIIDLGEIVESRYTGTIQYAPMEVDRWYNLITLDVQVGGVSIGLPQFAYATTNDVIGTFVDSGTGVVLFSPLIYAQVQSVFQADCTLPGICGNSSFFTGECYPSKMIQPVLSEYPSISFVVAAEGGGEMTLSVPASSYLMLNDDQYCSGLASVPGVGMVLGDLFMENYYIVFDRENSRLGFAPLASCS